MAEIGFWRGIRLALTGSREDLTRIPIGGAVALLAVPIVIEMFMQSAFGLCDVFFISRLGVEAVAAVGLTAAVVALVFATATGLSMATAAMVARRIGEQDHHGAGVAAVQGIALAAMTSLLIAVPGVIFAPRLLGLMGGSPQLVATGTGYCAVLLGGATTILVLAVGSGIFRGAGEPAIAMRVLWLANGVNLILDPCLIFGLGPFPELGVTGAAVATTIGRSVGIGCQFGILLRGRSRVRIGRQQLRLVPVVLRRLLRVASGGVGQSLVGTASWSVLVRIVGIFGSAPVAGYTIAMRIMLFVILPAWGIGNAAAILVGQNLGADQPRRAARSAAQAGLYNLAFLATAAVGLAFLAEPLIGIFTVEPATAAWGVDFLRLLSGGYCLFAYGMTAVQAFNGAGDTATPTAIYAVCLWLVQLPLAYLLARHTGLGAHGVFVAVMVAQGLVTAVAATLLRRGRWQRHRI